MSPRPLRADSLVCLTLGVETWPSVKVQRRDKSSSLGLVHWNYRQSFKKDLSARASSLQIPIQLVWGKAEAQTFFLKKSSRVILMFSQGQAPMNKTNYCTGG